MIINPAASSADSTASTTAGSPAASRLMNPQEENTTCVHRQAENLSLRPRCFDDYPGQNCLKDHLRVYVQASKLRSEPLDHVLLHGPPGLGKTTLARIIATELDVPFYGSSGPAVERPRDLVGILSGLEEGCVLFIDEIHRLVVQAEETLYTAMEDFAVDLVVGEGGSARSMRISLPPFTLVGATTKVSQLSRPLLSRFGIQEKLDYYDLTSLSDILRRSAQVLGMTIDEASLEKLALCSRGTPRIANRLLRRINDFATVEGMSSVTAELTTASLQRLGIDNQGLDDMDNRILKTMETRYGGGPVGIESLAVGLGEEPSTIEDVYEPFLVYRGYLVRTPRGRMLSDLGKKHLQESSALLA